MNWYCTVLICISHWLSIGHLDIRTDLTYTFSYFAITHVYDMLITYAISSMGKDNHTQIDYKKLLMHATVTRLCRTDVKFYVCERILVY